MNKRLKCVMLVDDDPNDNFIHERVIKKSNRVEKVVVKLTADDALESLKHSATNGDCHPDVIFLDINMPGMNGWEFLDEYNRLDKELQSKVVIVMLTTSQNPEDAERANKHHVPIDYRTKPLTHEMLQEVIAKYAEPVTG